MSEAGFTKGPWTVTTCLDYWVEHNQPRDTEEDEEFFGVALCGDIHWPNSEKRQEEWQANAALIAAAPDMYEALEALDHYWREIFPEGPVEPAPGFSMNDDMSVWRKARAALSKARGE